jgi:hypothetical protein
VSEINPELFAQTPAGVIVGLYLAFAIAELFAQTPAGVMVKL